MYWLWIEVKCRDPGCRHDRGFSAPCLGRILASITRSSSSSRRASEELSRQQHEIKHRRSYLGSTRSTIPGPSSTREPVQGFLQASMQPLDLPQHEQHNFHCCSSLLPWFLFKQPLDLPTWKTVFPSMFIALLFKQPLDLPPTRKHSLHRCCHHCHCCLSNLLICPITVLPFAHISWTDGPI